MPIGPLAKGTKETIHADYVDRSGTVTDLSGSGPTFDVIDFAEAFKVTAGGATASGLRISVPLDTTVGGTWAEGEYRLFTKFTVGADVIRKGPYYFQIVE
jgi:hypothetical protein